MCECREFYTIKRRLQKLDRGHNQIYLVFTCAKRQVYMSSVFLFMFEFILYIAELDLTESARVEFGVKESSIAEFGI